MSRYEIAKKELPDAKDFAAQAESILQALTILETAIAKNYRIKFKNTSEHLVLTATIKISLKYDCPILVEGEQQARILRVSFHKNIFSTDSLPSRFKRVIAYKCPCPSHLTSFLVIL